MVDDYESLERLSKTFQNRFATNQKKLNEIRTKQFQSITGDSPKVSFSEIAESHREFQRREKDQISILADEMNNMLLEKFKDFKEDESFKNKESMQKKILLDELEREYSGKITDALESLSAKEDDPLMPLLIHVDMLLQRQELSEKQKNHLRNVKQNILSGLDLF